MIGLGTKKILLLIVILLLPLGVFAGGQKEGDILVQVEDLIEQGYYNQAITYLIQVAKDEPSRFDDVNTLLQKVLAAQKEYNSKYANLLDTYETDLQESYVLIKELEDMNRDANDRTRESLIRARETAGFVFNRNRWEEIMAAALVQINNGEYWEAVDTYRSGFDLSRDIFDDFGYDPELVGRVDAATGEVNSFLDRFAEMETALEEHRSAENTAFNRGDLEEYTGSFNDLLVDLRELAELMVYLDRNTEEFRELEQAIRSSQGDDKEVHHLIYLELLILGREDSEFREGIIGIVDEIWTSGTSALTEHTKKLLGNTESAAYAALAEGDYDAAWAFFNEVPSAAVFDLKASSLWTERLRPGSSGELDADDTAVANLWIGRINDTRYRSLVSRSYLDYITGLRRIDELSTATGEITESSEGTPFRLEYQTERENHKAIIGGWKEEVAELVEIREEWLVSETLETINGFISDMESSVVGIDQEELKLIERMGDIDRSILEERIADIEELYSAGVEYLSGIPLEVSSGEETQEIMAVYPDRAAESLNAIVSPLTELKGDVQSVKAELASEPLRFRESELLSALVEREDGMLDRINALENGIESNVALAEEEIFNAQRYRQEGDRRMNESRQLLARAQYPSAKERLNAATLRYDESLTYQEDPELRNIRDVDIPDLFEEIQREENKLVIRQVREYLTEGQNLYSQTNFALANTLFLRAQNRWADTNAESNSEVEYWLELTKTALSVTTGREISQTDPLFTEMIQYLNQATEDFNSGVSYMNKNQSEDADISFNQAERNLLYVQQFFPFNKSARVLTIKIAQQRDPQGFKDLFSRDFNDARRQITLNPQQAYVELKDLEAIEPGYPGLQAAITEAEYATGIKVRPPDPRKIARAEELYADAQAIFNSNNRTEFQVALAYLDEAIALYPDYQDAVRLKDSVAVSIGGTSSEVLSNADQQKFQEAVAEFTAGNYLKAQIIVDILLNNKDNQNNTRLLELKERIESVR